MQVKFDVARGDGGPVSLLQDALGQHSPIGLEWLFAAATAALLFLLMLLASIVQQRRQARRQEVRDVAESRTRLQLALWGSGQWLWEFHVREGRFRCQEFIRFLGYPDTASLRNMALALRAVHPADRVRVLGLHSAMLQGLSEIDEVVRVRAVDGRYRSIRWRGRVAVVDSLNRPLRVTGTCKDVTEEREAERRLLLAGRIIESSSDAVIVLDPEFNIVSVNPAFARVTGYSAVQVLGSHVTRLCGEDQYELFEAQIRPTVEQLCIWEGNVWQKHQSGRPYYAHCHFAKIEGFDGDPVSYVAMFTDITARHELERQLVRRANFDDLTGLLTRTSFVEQAVLRLETAKCEERCLAMMFIDLDRFKSINDSLGHAAGDEVLCQVADILREGLRSEDIVARFGGDEFVVLLDNIANADDAVAVARKLLALFAKGLSLTAGPLVVSPSIGISRFPADAEELQGLLGFADVAMYHSKKNAPGSHALYDDRTMLGDMEKNPLDRHA